MVSEPLLFRQNYSAACLFPSMIWRLPEQRLPLRSVLEGCKMGVLVSLSHSHQHFHASGVKS